MHDEKGFALATVIIFTLIFAAGLAALYRVSGTFGKTNALYDRADYIEGLNRSAANAAGELIEQVILDKVQPSTSAIVEDAQFVTNDLLPSASADWSDSAESDPDFEINHGEGFISKIDVDYLPLTSGFSWASIKFGMAYQEAAAGNSVVGSQTYRVHTITTGPNGRRIESDAIYVVTP
jgi:hypothetical protein